jgi:hypothetical protein
VRRGVTGGFVQVSHGKPGPLTRIAPGDGIACYSPTLSLGGKDRLQAFTAIGRVRAGEPYPSDMGCGFRPFRRDVAWERATRAPIHPLLEILEFTACNRNWGYQFRFGLLSISERDFALIAKAMGV